MSPDEIKEIIEEMRITDEMGDPFIFEKGESDGREENVSEV